MANWIKRKIQQLSDKLNADENAASAKSDSLESGKTSSDGAAPDNIEVLRELTLGAITRAIKLLGYSNTVVSGMVFYSRFAEKAVENLGLQSLLQDADFANQIKRTLKAKGVPYKEHLVLEIISNADRSANATQIMEGIGVEVLTPELLQQKIRGRVVAAEGVTWEPEYMLEPTGKNYFIGRCKSPKIDNGPKIHNDIAFVGVEEKDEEQYKINNYVSRSHAYIVYDKEIGAFKIYRSKFLKNPAHKIKIYNTGLNDFAGVNLNQSAVPHVLRNGDSICLNDKIVLDFFIVNESEALQ